MKKVECVVALQLKRINMCLNGGKHKISLRLAKVFLSFFKGAFSNIFIQLFSIISLRIKRKFLH